MACARTLPRVFTPVRYLHLTPVPPFSSAPPHFPQRSTKSLKDPRPTTLPISAAIDLKAMVRRAPTPSLTPFAFAAPLVQLKKQSERVEDLEEQVEELTEQLQDAVEVIEQLKEAVEEIDELKEAVEEIDELKRLLEDNTPDGLFEVRQENSALNVRIDTLENALSELKEVVDELVKQK